jgi:transposase
MIRDRTHARPAERLAQWLADTEVAGVPELTSFAAKLRQDLDAVLAGLTFPYSQGHAEGRMNKLKLIKRSIYGRARFDLLRLRVLYAPAG